MDQLLGCIAQRDALIEELAQRNVTTYGAINVRTDGRKALFAYKLERPRMGGSLGSNTQTLTKWDLYGLEQVGNGPLVYRPDAR